MNQSPDLDALLTTPRSTRLMLRNRYRAGLVCIAALYLTLGVGWFWMLYLLIRNFGPAIEQYYDSLRLPFWVNFLGGIFLFLWGGLLNLAVALPGLLLLFRYSASAWHASKLGLSPTHDEALEIVRAKAPFVLYLRSYGIERRMEHDALDLKGVPDQAIKIGYEPPETKPNYYSAPALPILLEKTRTPVVCLRNQACPDPYRPSQLLEIDYFERNWLDVVERLAAQATTVVLDIDKLGRGLRDEIDALSRSTSRQKCVVVTDDKLKDRIALRCMTVGEFRRTRINCGATSSDA